MKGGVIAALVALVAGLAAGIAVEALDSARLTRAAGWLEPIGTLWVNAIRMTVLPLVIASLIAAAASSSPRAIGRLGTRAFALFLALLVLTALFTALVAPPVFALLEVDGAAVASLRDAAGASARPEMPGFAAWIVGVVPANPIRAAADGAMLPLVIFALLFGLAIGHAPEQSRESITTFFRAISDAMLVLVRWIVALAPLGVFILALGLARRVGAQLVGAVGFYLVAYSALLLVPTLLLYVIVAVSRRSSLTRFARAAAPAQLVGMTTRASLAALPAMLQGAERTLGISRETSGFVLPLGVSVFRLNQAVSWVAMALFAAKLYGVELDAAAVATLAMTSVITSFSVPGIPSASLFVVAPFYESVGLPAAAIAVLLAVDVVPDVFKTLLNVTSHMTAVTLLYRQPINHRDTESRR